jgi:hypothetical protein
LSSNLPSDIFSRKFTIFFWFSLTNSQKVNILLLKIDHYGNAPQGKPVQIAWLKIFELIGKSISEL